MHKIALLKIAVKKTILSSPANIPFLAAVPVFSPFGQGAVLGGRRSPELEAAHAGQALFPALG